MYFIIPSDLKGIEILVYHYCCTQAYLQNKEGNEYELYASLRNAEKEIGINKTSISRALKKLINKDYIELIEKGKSTKAPSKYLLKFTKKIEEEGLEYDRK